MATTTTNLSLIKPAVASAVDADLWGGQWNSNADILDSEAVLATVAKNWADFALTRPILKDYGETATSASSSSGTLTLDITNGNHFYTTLTENVTTLTLSNPSPTGNVCAVLLEVTQDGTGSWTFTFTNVEWEGGSAPTVTSTAGATDIYVFITRDAGTTWRGSIVGQNFS